MPDFKVTFKGDLGNLSQFDAAVRSTTAGMAKSIQQVNREIASSVGKIGLNKGVGLDILKPASTIDSINNTFRQSGQIVRKFVAGYTAELDKMGRYKLSPIIDTAYVSSFDKAIGNVKQWEAALKNAEPTLNKIMQTQKKFAQQQVDIANRRIDITKGIADLRDLKDPNNNGRLKGLISIRDLAAADLGKAAAAYAAAPTRGGSIALKKAQREFTLAEKDIQRETAVIDRAIAALERKLARLEALENRYATSARRRIAGLSSRPDVRAIGTAANATPPIQSDLATVLRQSESLRKELLKGGLGAGTRYGTEDFQKMLAQQEAQVTSYTRNLRTGVRTVQGEFKDLNGLMNRFTVDVDDNGKVIGRWGGQLSGAGSILRQTVRDFQKVIEWTIATTAVFGTLAFAAGQFQNINELNSSLARFSITAQTSATETRDIFQDLSRVAYETATPLVELVKVADDIALATRTAGQSTQEWRDDILALSGAVGIFTNLTGTDTVQAADQLSSAFKQLGIAPQQLIGTLNKVTAVAGGQAGAIADIVKALATVSEASRAAGLSIDEQIAAVQVLSQVTNKSASEVATSFKNLFGSISSVGSEKILKEFGIEIRDSTGGLRRFLDIYRDIAQALEVGIIPQNRLPDILRGISGGPRRAPDAAALLSNLGRIDEVVVTSFNATNEALVANAKILDTNQAKITKFQNSINTAIFERFGKAVEDLVGFLTDLGIAVSSAFNGISPDLVNLILKLGLVVTGIKVLGSVTKLVFGGLFGGAITNARSLSTALRDVGKYAKVAGLSMSAYESVPGSIFGPSLPAATGLARVRTALSNNKLAVGAGIIGAAGAGAGLLGGADSNTIGTLLQLGGAIGTLVPGLQGVGVAAIVAGTAIQLLGGNSGEAAKSEAELSTEIYNLTQNIQTSQREATAFADAQKTALNTIVELQSKTGRTADEQSRLSAATTDYTLATLGLAKANQEVSKTFDELFTKIPKLRAEYDLFKDSARQGILNPEQLRDLQSRLARDILVNTGQGIFAGGPIDFAREYRPIKPAGSTVVQTGPGGQTVDLSQLSTLPSLLLDLFNLNDRRKGDAYYGTAYGFTQRDLMSSDANIQLVQSALSQLTEDFLAGKGNVTEEQLQLLTNAIVELTKSASSFSQNSVALAQLAANIQAKIITGQFTGEQAASAQLAQTLAATLNQSALNNPARGESLSPDARQDVSSANAKLLELIASLGEKAANGVKLTNNELIEVAKTILNTRGTLDDLSIAGKDAIYQGIVETLKEAGLAGEQLDQIMKILNVTLQQGADAAVELSATLDAARQRAAEQFGERDLQLLIAENSGQFEGNAKGLEVLKEQNKQAYESTLQLIDATSQLSGTAFVDLNNILSQIVGLQGEYISQTELNTLSTTLNADGVSELTERQIGLGEKLIENAIKAGVNADGIKKLRDEVFKLIAAIAAIPPYKQIIIDAQIRLKNPGVSGPSSISGAAKQIADLQKQQTQGTSSAQKEIEKILKEINKIFSSGSGGNLGSSLSKALSGGGGGGGGSAYNKPGLLDIPEEIMSQLNYQQLLKQAVANAKKLQSEIPGESKANKNEIVALLDGTRKVLETRGVGEEYLRRALDELTGEIKRQNDFLTKADTIRRIRIGAGDISALANVPLNTKTGVSVGGPQGPINVSLNLNGTILTPAQFEQFANMVAAALKKQLAG